MVDVLATIPTEGEGLNIILLIGIAIFGGTVGARISQSLHIPRIVGYVAIGIVLGPVLGIISERTIQNLEPINMFALGIIGFLIGGELKRKIFVKFGKQTCIILHQRSLLESVENEPLKTLTFIAILGFLL